MISVRKISMVSLVVFCLPLSGLCGNNPFTVLPWNGYKAAYSLTFDDGDPCHLDVAIPEMTKRHLRGTFNLISSRIPRLEEWKKVPALGQEIGNHTYSHVHPVTFTHEEEMKQVLTAQKDLEKIFGFPILTFTYPFTEITPSYEKCAQTYHFISRGGWGPTYFLKPDMDIDWGNIPSESTATKTDPKLYREWIDRTLAEGCWFLIRIHGIEGTITGYQPIKKKEFTDLLDYLVSKRDNLWIAPFGEIGGYWRAQRIVEKAVSNTIGAKTRWSWERPAVFPDGVVLKMKIDGKVNVTQNGKSVIPVNGLYSISFDAKELTIETKP